MVVGAPVVVVVTALVVIDGDDPRPPSDRPAATLVRPAEEPVATTTTLLPVADGDLPAAVAIGGVTGVSVAVVPRQRLADGDTVQIAVDGLEHVPDGTVAFMCRGNVRSDTSAAAGCDPTAVTAVDEDPGVAPLVTEQMHVRVGRLLRLSGADSRSEPYDCALEAAGCLLVLAPYSLPGRGIVVPLSFRPDPLPEPVATLEAADGVGDGDEVVLRASSLRPRTSVMVRQCADAEGPEAPCDTQVTSATTDDDGRLDLRVAVRSAAYTVQGPVDCTIEPCHLLVEEMTGPRSAASGPITFAAGVVAPTPALTLDPPGPYLHQQTVTVRGTGFPPGRDIGSELAQCPGDGQGPNAASCGYGSVSTWVAADGTFTLERKVFAFTLPAGACSDTGCVLGWLVGQGTTIAAVPIEVTLP